VSLSLSPRSGRRQAGAVAKEAAAACCKVDGTQKRQRPPS